MIYNEAGIHIFFLRDQFYPQFFFKNQVSEKLLFEIGYCILGILAKLKKMLTSTSHVQYFNLAYIYAQLKHNDSACNELHSSTCSKSLG